MRKTKCKECNGSGKSWDWGIKHCPICQGIREIQVFTIQELREGKVHITEFWPPERYPNTPTQSVKIFLEEIEQ